MHSSHLKLIYVDGKHQMCPQKLFCLSGQFPMAKTTHVCLHFPYKAYACVIITHSLSWHPFYVYIFPTKHALFVISHILLGSSHCCIKLKPSHCNYENPPNAPKGEEQGRGIITQGCHRCS